MYDIPDLKIIIHILSIIGFTWFTPLSKKIIHKRTTITSECTSSAFDSFKNILTDLQLFF